MPSHEQVAREARGVKTVLERVRGDSAVGGCVTPGFEPVLRAFRENFSERGELGAAFAVALDGEPVVDLWGGLADGEAGSAWQEGTLQVIFSGTKALVALCLLILVDRGELDLAARVCRYWPEFAASGKEAITVAEVASHRARLPGIQAPVRPEEMLDHMRMAEHLASQPCDRDPRAACVYHPLTYGWLCGELVRRVDGRSLGRFFHDEVAVPLDLDVWIGLPSRFESRVSKLAYAENWGQRRGWSPSVLARDEFLRRVWSNPPVFPPGALTWNAPSWHRAEIPGAGGIGTARSLARLYGCLARGGTLDGVRLISQGTLAIGVGELARRWDPLIQEPQAFGVGFQLQTECRPFGPPSDAFGHGGAGGSIHCAWPAERIGLSYAMNLMRDDEVVDPRAQALLRAVHQAVHHPKRALSRSCPHDVASPARAAQKHCQTFGNP